MTDKKERPFDKDYVIDITRKHMAVCCDKSIRMTTARIGEFSENAAKSRELLETLSILHEMKRVLQNDSNTPKE